MLRHSILARRLNAVHPKYLRGLSTGQKSLREDILGRIERGDYRFENAACLCGSTDFAPLSNIDKHLLPMHIDLCRDCGMVLQSRRLDQKSLGHFYEHYYRELYNPGLRGDAEAYDIQIGLQPAHTWIMERLPSRPNVVFEVGIHFGALLHAFHQDRCQVAGSDYDSIGVQYARERLGMANCFAGPSMELEKTGQRADLLIYKHVFEHINDLDAELSTARRLLKDGGFLYLAVPGVLSWVERKEHNVLDTLQLAHSWYFTLPHLTYLAACHGFEKIHGDTEVQALFRKAALPAALPPAPDERTTVLAGLRREERLWQRVRLRRKVRRLFGRKG